MKEIYLDHAAGTPVHTEVLEEMLPYLKEKIGNPQSLHNFGAEAKEAIEKAREKVANLINCKKEEIYFTSCGTESNNLAIKGIAKAHQKKGKDVIVSSIEHFSVLHSAKTLEKIGYKVSYLPVDKYGLVDPEDVRKAINSGTILISIMQANNEIGTIEPIKEISKIAREKEIIFHTDAVATVGNILVDVKELGVDLMSFSANQFYGPKGIAGLYLRKGVRIIPLFDGGIQEEGRRAGTENVPAIVGMGKAAEIAKEKMEERNKKNIILRDKLIDELPKKIERIYLTGYPKIRLPNHASFCVEFIEGEAMLLHLTLQGVAISSGSACTSRALKASHVLLAIGIDQALAQGSIVFTLGEDNTEKEIDYVLKTLPEIVEKLRKMSPLYAKYLKNK